MNHTKVNPIRTFYIRTQYIEYLIHFRYFGINVMAIFSLKFEQLIFRNLKICTGTFYCLKYLMAKLHQLNSF